MQFEDASVGSVEAASGSRRDDLTVDDMRDRQAVSFGRILRDMLVVCLMLAINYSAVVIINESALIFLATYKDESVSAGVSLGFVVMFLFGFAINLGITSAMQTRVARYFGQGDYALMQRYLRQTHAMQVVATVCLYLPMILCSRSFVVRLTNEPKLAEMTVEFLVYSVPGMVMHVHAEIFKAYCMAQRINKVFGYCTLACVSIFLLAAYIFVIKIPLGLTGVAVAFTIYAASNLATAYAVYQLQSLRLDDTASLPLSDGFYSFAKYTAAYTLTEWIFYLEIEAVSLIAGAGGNTRALTVMSTFFTIVDLFYLFDMGVAAYTKSQVNYFLGQAKFDQAKATFKLINKAFVVVGLVLAAAFYLCKDKVARLFSPNYDIEDDLVYSLTFIVPSVVSELMHGSCECVLLSIGKEKLAVVYSLVSSLVGVYGFGYLLAYTFDCGMFGFVYAYSFSSFVSYPVLYLILQFVDWTAVVADSLELDHAYRSPTVGSKLTGADSKLDDSGSNEMTLASN